MNNEPINVFVEKVYSANSLRGLQKCWKLGVIGGLALSGAIATHVDCAQAQNITLDGTLGPAGTLTGPDYIIPQDVGQTVGSNLFHSFGQFNLNTGETVGFQSSADIRNILSRVTGGSISSIDGLIYTESPNVNLFLINPNGIIFGPNARLNVNGSFVASTADSLVFDNGFAFSATNPQAPPLLSVNIPLGLQYGTNPGSIQVQQSRLEVPEGNTLALLGGNVSIANGRLLIPGGRVELGGVVAPGTVELSENGSELQFNFPEDVARGDVTLTNGTRVDVRASGGGSIAINARNLSLERRSTLQAGIQVNQGFTGARAGDIAIDATGATTLTDESAISSTVLPGATGTGGNVNITTGSLLVKSGAGLTTSTFGQGDAGNVTITATDTVSFDGTNRVGLPSGARSAVELWGIGNGGDINITTNSLSVTNGAQLSTSTIGQGAAGNVTIVAADRVSFDGVSSAGVESAATSEVLPGANGTSGNIGNINITTGSLSVTNGAQLSASTRGVGDAGNVIITASDSVFFDGSSAALSAVDSGAVGNGGNVEIVTGSLSLTDGAQLIASTDGEGKAGNVTITATDTVFVDGLSGVRSTVTSEGFGNGGNVAITTGSLVVTNGSSLSASTRGQGNAGNVIIHANDNVSFDRSSVARSAVDSAKAIGNGGNVEIVTDSLSVTNGAVLSTSTTGQQGNAGNVIITATDSVSFEGTSSDGRPSAAASQVLEGAIGKGGNITITTGSLSVTDGAALSASTRGIGDAGNVIIHATDSITFDGVGSDGTASGAASQVSSRATGNGGNVDITTGSLSVTNGAQISARSRGEGNGGSVAIAVTDTVSLEAGGGITVSSLSGQAGNLTITANSLLMNRGSLTAETGAGQGAGGANIALQISDLLLMSNESLISAEAFGTANGGNITIDAGFLIALPPTGSNGSDIIANAQEGNGGEVNINTQGIFGIEFRPELTPLNDITANSQLGSDGTVNIDVLTIDPSQGVVELPVELVEVSKLIDRNLCTAARGSSFTATGRGGLPASPNEALSPEATWEDWRIPEGKEPSTEVQPATPVPTPATRSNEPRRIVEAQGWIIDANGKVVLTAEPVAVTPHGSWMEPADCQLVRNRMRG